MTELVNQSVVAVSFGVFLLLFTGVGIYSATRKKSTAEDYLVASRSVNHWVMALSAVATNNSGFMFIGLIGATYAEGLSAMWIMVGWVFGDYLAWLAGVPKGVREQSEKRGTLTIPSFMGHGIRGGRAVTIVAGILTLCFLGSYAAAQLTAGSKALHVLFGWDYSVGAILGAVIVAAYCFSGGIRASIWTDVCQSIVMLGAMLMMLLTALAITGGPSGLWSALEAIDPQLTSISPPNPPFGFAMFIIGWMAAGLGVVGQPHIMIRAMTLKNADTMDKARRIYISWYWLFSAAAIGVGLCARVILPGGDAFDPELAMPALAANMLPAVLVGLVLAGIFSATMSTADSQILSCSAAITQDILGRDHTSYRLMKAATIGITGFVLWISLMGTGVFALVTLAWSGLAASLGPIMVIRAFGRNPNGAAALLTMLSGLAAVLIWHYVLEFSSGIYHALPGMICGFLVYGSLLAAGKAEDKSIEDDDTPTATARAA